MLKNEGGSINFNFLGWANLCRAYVRMRLLTAVATSTLFDFIAVRLNPAKVKGRSFVLNWTLTDTGDTLALTLKHSTLTQVMDKTVPEADATVSTTRDILVALIVRKQSAAQAIEAGVLRIEGDEGLVPALFEMLDDFSMQFEVVAPRTD